ncbi:MAG TPA: AmmeMemoRadiSam system protein A [Candidatus Acidoferrales bacterium]|nr:AmmeMemoRadiSam system protein A [Candidatus Acidoferrales bacterium]
MSSLAEGEKKALLEIARHALTAAVECRALPSLSVCAALCRPGGAFVTITRNGRLRGCIGQLPSNTSLAEVVAYCARSVASEDPRFPRVEADELPAIEIELSVLSLLASIRPEEIEPGKHGLFVSNGLRRGVLLPQVAVQFRWNGMRFLEATCEKAGLARDAWNQPATIVQAFTAEVFSEAEFRIAEPSR